MSVGLSCGACGVSEGHKEWCIYARNRLAEVVPSAQDAYTRDRQSISDRLHYLEELNKVLLKRLEKVERLARDAYNAAYSQGSGR